MNLMMLRSLYRGGHMVARSHDPTTARPHVTRAHDPTTVRLRDASFFPCGVVEKAGSHFGDAMVHALEAAKPVAAKVPHARETRSEAFLDMITVSLGIRYGWHDALLSTCMFT